MHVHVCMHAHVYTVPAEAKRGHRIPPKLDLQVIMNHFTWALGTELGASTREARLLAAEPSLQPYIVLILFDKIMPYINDLSYFLVISLS